MIELTEDQREFIRIAREYEEMTRLPAWKHLWGFIEEHAAKAEAALYQSQSSDQAVQSALLNVWRERRRFVQAIEAQVSTAVSNRMAIMAEFMELMGASESQIEELIEKEKMVNG